jgi:hypothetical protein
MCYHHSLDLMITLYKFIVIKHDKPLNVVWMGVSTCHQANLCHKISTHQVVTTSSINHDANTTIFDDEENLE